MHYVRVTLVTGQQLTITVEVPPGTPVDQLQIPGLPAAIASIVDLGSTETTPTPTATTAPTVTATPDAAPPRRRRPRRTRPAARRRPKHKNKDKGKTKSESKTETPRKKTEEPTNQSGRQHRVADGQGREGDADPDARGRRRRPDRPAGRRARVQRPVVHALRARRGQDRRPELLHRQVPDPAVPAADLPGRGHAVRRPLGAAGRDQRDRDRLRPQPQRLLRRRAGLDAVHARLLEGLRGRRQQRRADGPVQPGRRDLRRRALPEGRRRRHGHPQGGLRLQPRRLVRRQRAAAGAGHRRPAVQPRRLAHRPHRGPLPGRGQGQLRQPGLAPRAEDDEPQPLDPARRRQPPRPGHLRRRRLAGGRGQRRAGDQDRRLEAARQLRPGPGRLRQHVHLRQAGQDLQALRRAQAAEGGPGRGQADAGRAARRQGAEGRGLGHRPAGLARDEQEARRARDQGSRARGRGARARPSRRSRSACSPTRRAPTPPPRAARSRSSCARAGSTAR